MKSLSISKWSSVTTLKASLLNLFIDQKDQQPDDDPSRRKNQEAFQPTGFSNYEQQDPSKNLQDRELLTAELPLIFYSLETEIKIPSFSQVFGGVMANNLSNVERTGHSTPGDVASPSNRISTLLDVTSVHFLLINSDPKTGKKYSNSPRVYNVQINEDINLIERIENLLTTISENYNRYCPGCQGCKLLLIPIVAICAFWLDIELKKSNFQNISAYFSRSKQRYYVVHFNCYLKSSSASSTKIRGLSDTPPGRCIQIQGPGLLEMSNYLRSDRRTYLITVEGYHPLNSQLFFRIDKTCFALEHANQVAHDYNGLDLTSLCNSLRVTNCFTLTWRANRLQYLSQICSWFHTMSFDALSQYTWRSLLMYFLAYFSSILKKN